MAYTGKSQGHLHTVIHGRKDRDESGLLFKVKGLKYNPETETIENGRTHKVNRYLLREINEFDIYDCVITMKKNGSINDSDDKETL
jgi:hypothetical protein